MNSSWHPSTAIIQRLLEFLVPILAFGPALLGVILWYHGLALNYSLFSAGCVLASLILAYLAWIRPRKDLVSLTTPLYALIFFAGSSDSLASLILQLFLAAGLVVLLIRLKRRFGTGPEIVSEHTLDPRISSYITQFGLVGHISSENARDAGNVFIQFARGNYQEASTNALIARRSLAKSDLSSLVDRALYIVGEQGTGLEKNAGAFEISTTFENSHMQFLAKQGKENSDQLTLDNALLVLYAAAYAGSPDNQATLEQFHDFAVKLIEG